MPESTAALAAWTAPTRAGYDASSAATAARVLPMLATEKVVWLSTVRPDGTPHLVPTWFWWDGSALVVWSKPGAVKVRNLQANPRLMLALGDPDDDFAVGLIEAEAKVVSRKAHVPDAFFAKYGAELGRTSLDPGAYRATYTQEVRIAPTRLLAWHGLGGVAGPPPARRPGEGRGIGSYLDRVAAMLGLFRPRAAGAPAAA